MTSHKPDSGGQGADFEEAKSQNGEFDEPLIEEIRRPSKLRGGPTFSAEEYHARATKQLALLLFWALFSMFATHFVSVICLAHNRPNSVEEVTRVFSTWVPVIAGLFGAAATFYFTQGRK